MFLMTELILQSVSGLILESNHALSNQTGHSVSRQHSSDLTLYLRMAHHAPISGFLLEQSARWLLVLFGSVAYPSKMPTSWVLKGYGQQNREAAYLVAKLEAESKSLCLTNIYWMSTKGNTIGVHIRFNSNVRNTIYTNNLPLHLPNNKHILRIIL